MENFFSFVVVPSLVLIAVLIIAGNKKINAFKRRNITLFNVLKVLALLFLFYRAVKTNKPDNYSFAIFYGFLAMYDTYRQNKEREKEKGK
jgi:hypothetical protein